MHISFSGYLSTCGVAKPRRGHPSGEPAPYKKHTPLTVWRSLFTEVFLFFFKSQGLVMQGTPGWTPCFLGLEKGWLGHLLTAEWGVCGGAEGLWRGRCFAGRALVAAGRWWAADSKGLMWGVWREEKGAWAQARCSLLLPPVLLHYEIMQLANYSLRIICGISMCWLSPDERLISVMRYRRNSSSPPWALSQSRSSGKGRADSARLQTLFKLQFQAFFPLITHHVHTYITKG